MRSLQAENHPLSNTLQQLTVLNTGTAPIAALPKFEDKLEQANLYPLRPTGIDVLQLNIGKMCNQTCKHCHVDAGPDRKEIMSQETMQQCLAIVEKHNIGTVDITGGAPEMNPHFRWLVNELHKLNTKVIVRCNLTIIVANKKYFDLPHFYAQNNVEIVSSLPFYTISRTDAQRGDGVFTDSIKALQLLNEVGYGKPDSSLKLNLVYNPSGAFLPASQQSLETDFKRELAQHYGIVFNSLYTITNLPISRFLNYLIDSGNYEAYMEKLVNAYNAEAAQQVMCRNTLSVSWDGSLYDCDFNQMLNLKVNSPCNHISEFSLQSIMERNIVVNQHCYGCTAGAGSSCGGSLA